MVWFGVLKKTLKNQTKPNLTIPKQKGCLEEAKHQLEVTQHKGNYETTSRLHYAVIPKLKCEIHPAGHCEGAMLGKCITSDDIAHIVARPTGIPMQTLLKEGQEWLVHVHASRSPCAFKLRNTC